MDSEAIAIEQTASRSLLGAWSERLSVYVELTKARLVALVVVTAWVGFVIGSNGAVVWSTLVCTLVGTALAALGANALNEWMEIRPDGRMERTRNRPLPAGRLPARRAFTVATVMLAAGPIVLVLTANWLAAALALAAGVIYLTVYTPLKRRSPLCTLVGAVCGALPPMVGWTAATGHLGPGAWVLGATLFVWQIPHFLALAWLYREDYARGGFRMLPVVDRAGEVTTVVVILYCLALLPVGLGATLTGLAGWAYALCSVLLGMGLLALGIDLYRRRTRTSARRLFLASIIYLPLLLGFMVIDRGPVASGVHVLGNSEHIQTTIASIGTGRASVDDRAW